MSYAPSRTRRTARVLACLPLLAGLSILPVHADNMPTAMASLATDPVTYPLQGQVSRQSLAKGLYQLEYSPSRKLLYGAVAGNRTDANDHGALLVIDPDTLQIIGRFDTQARAFGLALDDTMGRLYTTNTLDASVTMFDLNHDGRILKSVRLSEKGSDDKYPFRPREIRLDAAHHRLYVSALAESGRIYVLDSRTLDTVSIFENVGKKPTGLALDAAGQRLFLSNGDGDIQILSSQDGRLLGQAHVGTLPLNLNFDAATQHLFATDYKAQSVINIDVKDSARPIVTDRIATEKGPVALINLPGRHVLAVTEHDAGIVGLFDSRTGERLGRFVLGDQPNSLAVMPGRDALFVSIKQARAKDLSTPGLDSVARIDITY